MTNFSQLPREDQLDIIRFKSGDRTFYYSKIESLTTEVMKYDGKKLDITNVYNTIRDGLDTYEMYKLTMTSSEANEILRESAEAIIKEFYETKVDAMIGSFDNFATKMSKTISKTASDLSESDYNIKEVLDDVKSFKNALNDNVDNLDLSKINDKFQEKLEDIKEIKDKFTEELNPVQKQLGSLVSSLKELVTPSKK